jgi:hypothetical protein
MNKNRVLKVVSAALIGLAAICGTLVIALLPAVAATVCPSCYGLERISATLIVDRDMSADLRGRILDDAATAAARVRAFYGEFPIAPTVLACSTQGCDRRLGGKGALAVVYSLPFFSVIRVSPAGLNETVLAHEFSHIELSRRIGVYRQLTGGLPAWFNEGVAVIVSDDRRYLREGQSPQDRCLEDSAGALPETPFEWAPLGGRKPEIYAQAACRVLKWMDANGDRYGLIGTLDRVGSGFAFVP